MQVSETHSGYELSFRYDASIVADVKAIPGHKWIPTRKVWSLPRMALPSIQWLLRKYGVSEQEAMPPPEDVGAIPALPDLQSQIPLKRPLYRFQEQGVAYCLKQKRVIMGDQPGLGKTSQAIATIVAAQAWPCLVVCPASLKLNWEREWMTVAGERALILSDRNRDTWPQFWHAGIVKIFIVNYESLKKYFVASISKKEKEPLKIKHILFNERVQLFQSVIADELHRCKDGSTQQAKFMMGIAAGKEWRLGLTGTPVVNKPVDLVSQLHIIGQLQAMGGYSFFMKRYCNIGSSYHRELHCKLATTCFYQRQKKDVLTDLPDKVRQIVLCDISNRKEYNDALADLADYLKRYRDRSDDQIEKSLRGEVMVRIGICKNISARGKMADVVEYVDEVVEGGNKIVVFIHQREIAAAIKKHYPDALSITGEDKIEDRQASVDKFQNDPRCKIIVCNIKAGGVGITLTASNEVLFVELPWHPADCDQCEDRTHRIGQKNSVRCGYMLGKGTIDEEIYKIIEAKRATANTITGTEDNVQREIIDRISDSLFKTDKLIPENYDA